VVEHSYPTGELLAAELAPQRRGRKLTVNPQVSFPDKFHREITQFTNYKISQFSDD